MKEEEATAVTAAAPKPAAKKTVVPAVTAPGIVLPTAKTSAVTRSPRSLVIFAKPKVGKTSLVAALDNCLVLDLESGTDYVDALKLKATNVQEIKQIIDAIVAAGKPYKYIAVDTITALEEIALPYAEKLYADSPMGKSWFTEGKPRYKSLLNMPNGSGYPWLREAFTKLIDYIKRGANNVILIGHLKDTMLEKNGSEFNSMELDLTGKLKRITTSNADAIGYLYRKGDQNVMSFKTSDEVSCGARPEHLRNQEIVISEITETGEMITHWDKIYID